MRAFIIIANTWSRGLETSTWSKLARLSYQAEAKEDIARLVYLAYPIASQDIREEISAFVRGLND